MRRGRDNQPTVMVDELRKNTFICRQMARIRDRFVIHVVKADFQNKQSAYNVICLVLYSSVISLLSDLHK